MVLGVLAIVAVVVVIFATYSLGPEAPQVVADVAGEGVTAVEVALGASAPVDSTGNVLGSPSSIQQMIIDAVAQCSSGLDLNFCLGIASEESGFNASAIHLNKNGTSDYGVYQLNSATVQTLGVSDPLDPQQNINAAINLLCGYWSRYGGDVTKVAQAYALGPGTLVPGYTLSATQQATLNKVLPIWLAYTPAYNTEASA